MRLFALRGANSVESNQAEAILSATTELMHELMDRNDLAPEAMVSCIFTLTHDLDAEFPAVAARRIGLNTVPLLCAREIPVPGSLSYYFFSQYRLTADESHQPRHVYLGEA